MKIPRPLKMLAIRKSFEDSISPAALSCLARGSEPLDNSLRKMDFQFVIANVDDSDTESVPRMLEEVTAAFVNKRAMISAVTSSIVIGLYGVPFRDNNSEKIRKDLVAELIVIGNKRIRVIHGQCEGLVGMLGSKGAFRYDGIIPKFSEVLTNLFSAEFGSSVELPKR